jgi:hypothetical protein
MYKNCQMYPLMLYFNFYISVCVYVCVCVCMCVSVLFSVEARRENGELELQETVNLPVWVRRIELWSPETVLIYNHWRVLGHHLPPQYFPLKPRVHRFLLFSHTDPHQLFSRHRFNMKGSLDSETNKQTNEHKNCDFYNPLAFQLLAILYLFLLSISWVVKVSEFKSSWPVAMLILWDGEAYFF